MTATADPLGGSAYVEWMTDEMERRAEAIFAHLDDLGGGSMLEGVLAGIDNGWIVNEIADAAYRYERAVNTGERVVVGVNRYTDGDDRIRGPAAHQRRRRSRPGRPPRGHPPRPGPGRGRPGPGRHRHRRRRTRPSTSCPR